MLEFLSSLPEYDHDEPSKMVWFWIKGQYDQDEGICYYKHPLVVTTTGILPHLSLFTRNHEPLAIRCLPYQLNEIGAVDKETWTVAGQVLDSPVLELEDFVVGLQSKFDKDRTLRRRLKASAVLALPLVSQGDFEAKFGSALEGTNVIWADGNTSKVGIPLDPPLSDQEWRITRAISQGIVPLKNVSNVMPTRATTLGEAMRQLDRQIAILDKEQEKVALQVAPGPQRIRGLAGTGKTVILAMKAANIHLRYPNATILFTFNTQSLYNQAKTLISKFYRFYSDVDPNWDNLHIRHSWGGRSKPGVYYDLCGRQGKAPLNFRDARAIQMRDPFEVCCRQALKSPIEPQYEYILVDEAQDFPNEFFQILYKLSSAPHQIYWAYDELQSLTSFQIRRPEEQFGLDDKGLPLVTLEGDDYPGGIEKDFVLHRSYRCPQAVLMLAHAIGLGLYGPQGCVQMLQGEDSWKAFGYVLESGTLQKGENVVLYRPPENSPNPIAKIYQGQEKIITAKVFADRSAELDSIAESIAKDIKEEGIAPEQIIVISLNKARMKDYLSGIQMRLIQYSIASTIPGLIDDTAAFGETGRVTLSTVYRAKGNESYVVYILSFDSLYDFVREVESRNSAFTSITRSMAWVRISGVGKKMEDAKNEIDKILADQPRFRFVFPDMEAIRRLDAETSKRRKAVVKAKDSVAELVKLEPQALAALADSHPELLDELLKKIEEAKRDNQ